jgi:hypothetical protein
VRLLPIFACADAGVPNDAVAAALPPNPTTATTASGTAALARNVIDLLRLISLLRYGSPTLAAIGIDRITRHVVHGRENT